MSTELFTNCADIYAHVPTAHDGHYWMKLVDSTSTSAVVPVYCYQMELGTPTEYITLPEGEGINHSMRYKYRNAAPPTCQTNDILSTWVTLRFQNWNKPSSEIETYHNFRNVLTYK